MKCTAILRRAISCLTQVHVDSSPVCLRASQMQLEDRPADLTSRQAADAIFADAEQQSERTLAYLRLAAFFVLLVLLRILDFFDQHHGAMIALGAYGAATVLAFGLTFSRTHYSWLPWALMALDIALVLHFMAMLVIYGGLSPAAALTAPGTLLIFLILAQATVRYRPVLIVLASVLFIAGWISLHVLPGVTTAHSPAPWQTDELAYIGLLLLTALTLFLAAKRTHRLLITSIGEARLRATLSRFVPANLVQELAERGHDLTSPHAQKVAVLFVDMRGFTAAAESMSPTSLLAFLNEYRHRMVSSVEEHHGTVDKFIGDAVMAVFGLPKSQADDALRALRCGLAMIESIDAWNRDREMQRAPPVRVSIGIHFGDATVGAIGVGERLEYTVIGDTVNVAQRVERLAAEADTPLLVSAELLEAAGEGAQRQDWVRTQYTAVRGRYNPVELYMWKYATSPQIESLRSKREPRS